MISLLTYPEQVDRTLPFALLLSVLVVCISVQETINLLSGGTSVPPGSTLTLARALLLLSDLREGQNTTLLNLLYALLKNEVNAFISKQILNLNCFIIMCFFPIFFQLRAFGLSVVMENGQMSLFPPKPSNIYLPYLKLLTQDTANE